MLADSRRMERLVEDLLYLARADEGRVPTVFADLDLDDVVLEEVARLRPGTHIRIDTSAVSAAPMVGNRLELGQLTRNLLENAVRHAVSRVGVELADRDGFVGLAVEDDGPGIPAEDRSASSSDSCGSTSTAPATTGAPASVWRLFGR